jgi:F-type H+-transporting ATPase subunit a
VSITEALSERLVEELGCQTVFTIPIFGGIPIAESVVVTWIIMGALTFLSILLVRNFKVENPGKKQMALEVVVGGIYNFFKGLVGEAGERYIFYLMSVAIYLGVANLIGLIGFKPPTKDMNVTAALAVMSIVLVEYSGFHKKGLKGFVKSFAEPMALITPLNVLELFIRPLSLCMRLFGNILGAFVIMELVKMLVPAIIPIPFSCYFDIFDGLLQAYIFVFLTSLFMKEALE